jgi:Domain of unknown function (DUF4304)
LAEQTASSLALDAWIRSSLAPTLRQFGYRRRGRSFALSIADLHHCVGVQASRGGTPAETQFAVNVYVIWPRWHCLYIGQPLPRNPAGAEPVVSWRVMPTVASASGWWTVTPTSDSVRLSADVLPAVLAKCSEFRDRYSDSSGLLAALDAQQVLPGYVLQRLVYAALLVDAGRARDAQVQVAEAARESPAATAVARVAARLGLESAD